MSQNNIQSQPQQPKPKLQLLTNQQFQQKGKQLLQQMKYRQVEDQLRIIYRGDDNNFISNRRIILNKLLKQHVQKMYGLFSQPNQLLNSIDLQLVLDLIAHSITLDTDNQSDLQTLYAIVKHSASDDTKFIFMILRPIFSNFDRRREDQYLYALRKIKLISCLYLLINKIVVKHENLFEDFVDILKQSLHLFYLHSGQQLNINMQKQVNQQQQQDKGTVYQAYLNFIIHVVQTCHHLMKQHINNQNIMKKINQILQNTVSHILLMTKNIQSNLRLCEKTLKIQKIMRQMLLLYQDPLKLNKMSKIPQLLLIILSRNNIMLNILSRKHLFYVFCRILIKYSQQYTTSSQVGHPTQKISAFLQKIIIYICQFIIDINDGKINQKIEGQKIYMNQTIFIQLIPIYKRILVFLGFISPQHSKMCHTLISEVLKFKSQRLNSCPIVKISIWSQLLNLSSNSEVQYRIFCINQYRKLLIEQKNQICKGNFEFHKFHTHSQILVNAYQKVQIQMQMIMVMGITNINCDYIGHVISLMSNFLTCVRFYCNKYDNYHSKKLIKLKSQMEKLNKSLIQKIAKHLQVLKQENIVMQHQLISFRCKQLDFS